MSNAGGKHLRHSGTLVKFVPFFSQTEQAVLRIETGNLVVRDLMLEFASQVS